MEPRELVEARARAAREGARALALSSTRIRNDALAQMARALEEIEPSLDDQTGAPPPLPKAMRISCWLP